MQQLHVNKRTPMADGYLLEKQGTYQQPFTGLR